MTNTRVTSRGSSRKFLVTTLTAGVILAASRPGMQAKVYATGNSYDWTKQVDQDLLGGSYTSVASSASGSHLIIGAANGGENNESPLFVSDDYGSTWENISDTVDSSIRNNWTSVDVTDNGETMVAASNSGKDLNSFSDTDGKIFISQNAGESWQDITPDGATIWHNVVISGNGSKIVATADDDLNEAFISTNGGTSWTTTAISSVSQWESLSISDNGDKVLIGGESSSTNSFVDISTNGGTDWTDITPDSNTVFTTRTAMSADGSKIVVSTYAYDGDNFYDAVNVSTNDGTDWTDITPGDRASDQWNALAMSGNGSVLAAEADNGDMFSSRDNGGTWAPENPGEADSDSNEWRTIDFNTTGSLAITASDTNAYVSYTPDSSPTPAPTATVTNAETGASVVVTTPEGTTITCHSGVKESGLTAQDGAYSYPAGLVDFCFSGADTANAISLTFVTDLKPSQVTVRKYNPNTKTYATITSATVTETTYGGQHALLVSYNVADNGPLDTNPTVGEVSDPVGLATLDASTPTVPNTGIPTQSRVPFIAAGATGFGILTALTLTYRRRKLHYAISTRK